MNVFSSGGVDRAAQRRRDEAWLAERARDAATRFVPVWREQNRVLLGDAPRAVLLSGEELGAAWPAEEELILLGEAQGRAVFAFDLRAEEDPGWEGEFVDLHRVGALLEPAEAALLAQARGITYWHRRHRYCGECGAPTRSAEAGHLRLCTGAGCGARHFPRTDPAIIVLVTRGDRCLLARQAHWPERRYAALAGFVEPGEGLEDAVAREVREEVGLELREVRYHSSQPWPFPSSLMLGFTARAAEGELRIDREELEEARWLTREELADALRTGAILPPSRVSIAYALLRDWLGFPP